MTAQLQRQAKATATAGRNTSSIRIAWLVIGAATMLLGFQAEQEVVAVLGALVSGAAGGQLAVEPGRFYMEGFTDGLIAADTFGAAAAGGHGEPRPDVRGLPAVPAGYDDRGVAGAGYPDQRGVAAASAGDVDPVARAIALGADYRPGPPRSRLAPDGSPLAATGLRAGRSSFPDIPAAVSTRTPDSEPAARTATGSEAGDGQRKVRRTRK